LPKEPSFHLISRCAAFLTFFAFHHKGKAHLFSRRSSMKRLLCFFLFFLSSLFVFSPSLQAQTEAHISIPVHNMTCSSCTATIEGAVRPLEGVKTVQASKKEKAVLISYDPQKVLVGQLLQAIIGAGYTAGMPEEQKK